MIDLERRPEVRELGKELHAIEEKIHMGKQNLWVLRNSIPLDVVQIEYVREGLHGYRQDHADVKTRLEAVKNPVPVLLPYNWHV